MKTVGVKGDPSLGVCVRGNTLAIEMLTKTGSSNCRTLSTVKSVTLNEIYVARLHSYFLFGLPEKLVSYKLVNLSV